ncbi:RsmB/NOP family class I SAM-dependent RNA methyltransferase [Sulfitobacter sp. S190]|uniref:RsmB/NOP family class I SAM-dependent RNA methyltransferase n=1 Tax=Sulfitobacter sp. S190 TaxID=2867022 RepID=UPI0021A96B8C|nr:RsmB/NOP family class I SAM-dependent RNA methyltransferase [Sulfitobacter sp. S190]UWR23996.1 RsmB/NOP family class I SAM-dependent RNA methyltransferase [Sulfitobacter sp. S190]
MTPGARIAAAIEILDQVGDGLPAEQILTRWGRNNRFAGSKDRAAIRDHVFDVLRCRRSAAHAGGASTGRGLMLGLLRLQGIDPATLFNGEGHAPAALEPHEIDATAEEMPPAVALDLPDWLLDAFRASLGYDADKSAQALQNRAPVTLRVNLAQTDKSAAIAQLGTDGVSVVPNPLADTALRVTDGSRRIRNGTAYQSGMVELQDAASQAVVMALPDAQRLLDYCAGGGGKALAMAARSDAQVTAHDADPNRMKDIAPRAERAGVSIETAETSALVPAGYDLVLTDVPCSGSGSWRRAPEAKWHFTPDRLQDLTRLQDDILDRAAMLVAPRGTLAYATCSVLRQENGDRIAAFLDRHPQWSCNFERSFTIDADGDGFYTAHLTAPE